MIKPNQIKSDRINQHPQTIKQTLPYFPTNAPSTRQQAKHYFTIARKRRNSPSILPPNKPLPVLFLHLQQTIPYNKLTSNPTKRR
jgi:hypothetical protein